MGTPGPPPGTVTGQIVLPARSVLSGCVYVCVTESGSAGPWSFLCQLWGEGLTTPPHSPGLTPVLFSFSGAKAEALGSGAELEEAGVGSWNTGSSRDGLEY